MLGNGKFITDHPRSRGEYRMNRSPTTFMGGSSPLSRGIHQQPKRFVGAGGIIPALAGNTGARRDPGKGCGDHPRSRGEYTPDENGGTWGLGSSPLSRGIRGFGPCTALGLGIIPALAGNTSPCPFSGDGDPDHPRSRGEYVRADSKGSNPYGSSPLSRGIHTR